MVSLSVRDGLSGEYFLSPWPNLALTSQAECLQVKVCRDFKPCFRSTVKVVAEFYINSLFDAYLLSPLSNLPHTVLILSVYGQRMCSDLRGSLYVKVISDHAKILFFRANILYTKPYLAP